MIIFPAIDIRGGKCVRLIQGDYSKETVYGDSPIDMARIWEKKGATYIHVVDLDGAKSGHSQNKDVIREIVTEVNVPVQVGGGIRSMEVIRQYLSYGVSRVILGTSAIDDLSFVTEAVKTFTSQVAISLDARNGLLATEGWTETSTTKAVDILPILEDIGVQTIVYTDIAKDGMLQGPNIDALAEIHEATSMDVIASGGVTTMKDMNTLRELDMYGAIVGKALYEGRITLEEIVGDYNEK